MSYTAAQRQQLRRILMAEGGTAWRTFPVPPVNTVMSLSSLGIGANGRGTYVIRATLTSVSTGTAQVFFQIDSGAATTRFLLQAAASSAIYQLARANSGSATTNGGAISAAVPINIGMSIDGTGAAIASINGATAISVAGGPTSGLTTLRIGAGVSAGAPLVGSIAVARLLIGQPMTAGELQKAVAELTR